MQLLRPDGGDGSDAVGSGCLHCVLNIILSAWSGARGVSGEYASRVGLSVLR